MVAIIGSIVVAAGVTWLVAIALFIWSTAHGVEAALRAFPFILGVSSLVFTLVLLGLLS